MNIEQTGKNLEAIRKARGMSLKELADAVGTSLSTVEVHSKNGIAKTDFLMRYAEALGCTIADLVDGTTDPTAFELPDGIYGRYPWNLAAEVMRINEEDSQELYSVYIPALIESMSDLSDRESEILTMRYKHHMTLEQVANAVGVTRERVRQVEARAIRKLRHPRHWKHWQLDTMERYIAAEEKASALELENMRLRSLVPEPEPDKEKPNVYLVTIEDLELSVRSYNCLKRAGYETLGDLVGKTTADLAKCRNLGRKSMEEVIAKAKEHGVVIAYET